MAQPTAEQGQSGGPTAGNGSTGAGTPAPKAPPPRNPALRMLGLPALPRKLPSRNWMIFLTATTLISGAIIYDRREKRRATARWAHAVSHLAKEPLPGGVPTAMPRKLTIYLCAPPGDGLRVAQEHFAQYVKPVLAASGLDWEFVQGRQEGDVRAVVAERLRRVRRGWEKDLGRGDAAEEDPEAVPTEEEMIEATRRRNGTPEYEGVRGDLVIGRHTWKEYVRGIHEGWLGPLALPPEPEQVDSAEKSVDAEGKEGETQTGEEKAKDSAEEKKKEEQKPKRPPQPQPHNTVDDYPASPLPLLIPAELSPSALIPHPHILGFLNTPTRLVRFFNRRALADSIGRDVAAVCLGTYREFRELPEPQTSSQGNESLQYEQQLVLQQEEKDWIKSVWAEEIQKQDKESSSTGSESPKKERIWPRPVVLDARIASRMRKFELQPEDEARAGKIVIPEEEIEGWIKGSLRSLFGWGAGQFSRPPPKVIVSDDD